MRTSKQIDKEYVSITVAFRVEDYFRLKFRAENNGYNTLAEYVRDALFPKEETGEEKETQIRFDV